MKYLLLIIILLINACSELPENKLESSVVTRDNYTYIDTSKVTTTTNVNHISNNETISTNTIYVPNLLDNNTTITPVLTQSVYELSLKGGPTGNVTLANWNADNLTVLNFHIHGKVDSAAINQTGITPANTMYKITDNGFFDYNLSKVQMSYVGAVVNPDNISNVQLIYQTKLYPYIKKANEIIELESIVYTLNVN